MLNQIKLLLRPADKLTRLAKKRDRAGFEREFVSREVVVLQAPAKELDPSLMDEETLLREIESATRALSEAEGITPYIYSHNGVKVFPLFSSQENAQTFIGELSKERGKIIPFGFIEIFGRDLLKYLRMDCRVVLNPRTRGEVDITELLPATDDA